MIQEKRNQFTQQLRKARRENQFQSTRKEMLNSNAVYNNCENIELKSLEATLLLLEQDEGHILDLAKSNFLMEQAIPFLRNNDRKINLIILKIFSCMLNYAKRHKELWIVLQFRHSLFLNCISSIDTNSIEFQNFITSLIDY